MKTIFEFLLIIIAIAVLFYLFFYFASVVFSPETKQNNANAVCLKDKCFSVELAKNDAERERGLMDRTELDMDSGMFFIFEKEGIYPFWMKNTLIPLDIIWINKDHKIVFISKDVQPCKTFICPSVSPGRSARYVLEINAGLSKKYNFKEGDQANIYIK